MRVDWWGHVKGAALMITGLVVLIVLWRDLHRPRGGPNTVPYDPNLNIVGDVKVCSPEHLSPGHDVKLSTTGSPACRE